MSIIIEIEKFLEYNLNKRISNRDKNKCRLLKGSFKEKGSNQIIQLDTFKAYELIGCSVFEVYECYVKYFNYTIQTPDEKERIPISAMWIEEVG